MTQGERNMVRKMTKEERAQQSSDNGNIVLRKNDITQREDDIVERLRGLRQRVMGEDYNTVTAAQDRIEELEAEIERLRGAFKAEKEMKDG